MNTTAPVITTKSASFVATPMPVTKSAACSVDSSGHSRSFAALIQDAQVSSGEDVTIDSIMSVPAISSGGEGMVGPPMATFVPAPKGDNEGDDAEAVALGAVSVPTQAPPSIAKNAKNDKTVDLDAHSAIDGPTKKTSSNTPTATARAKQATTTASRDASGSSGATGAALPAAGSPMPITLNAPMQSNVGTASAPVEERKSSPGRAPAVSASSKPKDVVAEVALPSGSSLPEPIKGTPLTDRPSGKVEPGNSDDDSHGAFFIDKLAPDTAALQSNFPSITGVPPGEASFHFSLQAKDIRPSQISNASTIDAAIRASAAPSDSAPHVLSSAASRHLEVAVDDPVMGNIGVRAEMRSGALHAVISGSQGTSTVAADLQQFLQKHDVALHSLSFASPPIGEVRPPSMAEVSTSNGGMDLSSSNQASAQGQRDPHPSASEFKHERSREADVTERGSATPVSHGIAHTASPSGSTLSIHI